MFQALLIGEVILKERSTVLTEAVGQKALAWSPSECLLLSSDLVCLGFPRVCRAERGVQLSRLLRWSIPTWRSHERDAFTRTPSPARRESKETWW